MSGSDELFSVVGHWLKRHSTSKEKIKLCKAREKALRYTIQKENMEETTKTLQPKENKTLKDFWLLKEFQNQQVAIEKKRDGRTMFIDIVNLKNLNTKEEEAEH